MVETGSQIPFRESISQAPEFTQPFVANTLFGRQEWPFEELQTPDDGSNKEKVVFEARGLPSDETDPLIVRVSYEAPYGLKVKRTVILREFPNSEPIMQSAEVKYVFDDVDISIAAALESPIVTAGISQDPQSFKPTVTVTPKDNQNPPLVFMDYRFSSRIPLHVQFANADYQQALRGELDKRSLHWNGYSWTYFQWENFTGAKVGIARYDNPDDNEDLRLYRWFTQINSPTPMQLEDSPYRQKLSISEDRRHWGGGRLRFGRMNAQAGESWMFSAPEWINIYDFHRDIQHSRFIDFNYQYPVVFCVKNRGEERKWLSTHYKIDKARGQFRIPQK